MVWSQFQCIFKTNFCLYGQPSMWSKRFAPNVHIKRNALHIIICRTAKEVVKICGNGEGCEICKNLQAESIDEHLFLLLPF